MLRVLCLCFAIGGFAALAVLDLATGNLRTGVASLMLALANYLLLK